MVDDQFVGVYLPKRDSNSYDDINKLTTIDQRSTIPLST